MKIQHQIRLRSRVLALALPLSLATFTAVAQGGLPLSPDPKRAPVAWPTGMPQHKGAGTAQRLFSYSIFSGTSAGLFTPSDSQRFYYVPATPNVCSHAVNFTYSAGWWLNNFQYVYTYDGSGYLTQEDDPKWNFNTSSWDNKDRFIDSNNAAGEIEKKIYQSWDNATGVWVNNTRDSYSYDASNYLADEIHQVWSNGAWLNADHYLFTNNAQGSVMQEIIQSWASGAWNDVKRYDFTYDAGGLNLTQTITLTGYNNSWTNLNRFTYALNAAGKPSQMLLELWDFSGAWTPYQRTVYAYDAPGNNTSRQYDNWNVANSVYQHYAEITDTFTSFNQPMKEVVLYWLSGAYGVNSSSRLTNYYYEPYTTGITGIQNGIVKLSAYPNPGLDDLHLSLRWEVPQSFGAAVTDMAGKVYITFTAPSAKEYSSTLSVKDLPAGNYVLSIRGSNGGAASQMITIKK